MIRRAFVKNKRFFSTNANIHNLFDNKSYKQINELVKSDKKSHPMVNTRAQFEWYKNNEKISTLKSKLSSHCWKKHYYGSLSVGVGIPSFIISNEIFNETIVGLLPLIYFLIRYLKLAVYNVPDTQFEISNLNDTKNQLERIIHETNSKNKDVCQKTSSGNDDDDWTTSSRNNDDWITNSRNEVDFSDDED